MDAGTNRSLETFSFLLPTMKAGQRRRSPGMRNTLPIDLIGPGGRECASTSLHHYRKQHPYVSPPNVEGKDFSVNEVRQREPVAFPIATTFEEFRDSFAGKSTERIVGGVSSAHLHRPDAAPRIRHYYLNGKRLAMLRRCRGDSWLEDGGIQIDGRVDAVLDAYERSF